MITLYAFPTPNAYKISILLEELAVPYQVETVNIWQGDQLKPEFLAINPNNKIPAIHDNEGPGGKPYAVFESGAILLYLAEKHGKFIPNPKTHPTGYYDVLQWLMFQMAGVGPMCGQAHHFRQYAPEKIDYAIKRYTNEVTRLYKVIDHRLSESKFLGGKDYSIADMAVFPWLRPFERQGQDITLYPHIQKWMAEINARPATERGLNLLKQFQTTTPRVLDEKSREIMFGSKQIDRKL
ncbi:MAG: glutathione S-transferase N-terminal domain-containing protein [Alphaproteobacteria bacterium]|nr:glutathione S-transferase N-terminal domain-containing protein [Alphaproteobacteria bacterium]